MASEHITKMQEETQKEIIDIIIQKIYGEERLNDANLRNICEKLVNTYIVKNSKITPETNARIIISIAKNIAEGRMQDTPVKPTKIPIEMVKRHSFK